ncbi:MAG: nucleotidyltransferase domain-containing protein [Deltaproteobacteria bacterium]|nr:nucleotidyltransferase domain-containing protein [Deltaproteobacteria bacterium]
MGTMKLTDNEKKSLDALHKVLFERYPVVDFRLFGSKARGEGVDDSDMDVMIEIPEYDPVMVAEIDDLIYRFNLEYDVFISALFFGKNELEEGPLSEAPIYKAIQREGVPL